MRKLIALLPTAFLIGCGVPTEVACPPDTAIPPPPPRPNTVITTAPANPYAALPTPRYGPFQSVYHATLPAGLLRCGNVDLIHASVQPMVPGNWQGMDTAGITVSPAGDGALAMAVKAPSVIPKDSSGNLMTPSVGIFSSDTNFGPGTVFSVSATFQKPARAVSLDSWSVTVVARTGGVADTPDLARLQLSLRVKNGQVELRAQEGLDDPSTVKLPNASVAIPENDTAYSEIYNSGEPFTLRLFVNRQTGFGSGTLTTRTQTRSFPFRMGVFTAVAGSPKISTIGAALANTGTDLTASVEVIDFELLQTFSERPPI